MVKNAELNRQLMGYMLLPVMRALPYQGIDRNPFLPTLTQEVLDSATPLVEGDQNHVWRFYPPGWQRDAYRLYEENSVPDITDNLYLLANRETATAIKRLIEPHLGLHEIIFCGISNIEDNYRRDLNDGTFLGHDVAYLGGDFFSAVRAAFFGSRWFDEKSNPRLTLEFKSFLNQFCLFSITDPIPRFIHRFREEAPSEAHSTFYIWSLTKC
jgi:hypothetical protein